ncbi:MAG TPA: RHS repeat-associated core domain-containing protein, partial [Variovorax sp.]
TASAGQGQYIYLPTANGPMPIAAVINGSTYAIHSDHLNTPRKLTNADGQAVWQWGYSAFGEDKPTTARNRFANTETTPSPGTTNIAEVRFNLRYPGQYSDDESGLFYNYFRSYDSRTGRYSQPDPIGLNGGWNRFGYVNANPMAEVDPLGLYSFSEFRDDVRDATGGCSDQGFMDDVISNFVDVQDQTSLLKTGMSLGLGGAFAKQYGGLTALGAAAEVYRDNRSGFRITGVGARTFGQAAATGGATWLVNGVLIKGSFDAGVLGGSVLRSGINRLASGGCGCQR